MHSNILHISNGILKVCPSIVDRGGESMLSRQYGRFSRDRWVAAWPVYYVWTHFNWFSYSGLEEARNQLEIERAKLLTQCREVERSLLSSEKHAQTLTEELHKASSQSAQKLNEEKELNARLLVVSEERDKAQQDLHAIKKQVREHV
jgi:Protein of unknown function (DUF2968).